MPCFIFYVCLNDWNYYLIYFILKTKKENRTVNILKPEGYYQAQSQAECQARLARLNLVYKTPEMPHLKCDTRYHRNSEKNIEYLRTCNGTIIPNVYTEPEETFMEEYKRKYTLPPLSCANLHDIKLCNPLNNLKRNRSQINFFPH